MMKNSSLGQLLQERVLLQDKSWFGTSSGVARWYAEPSTTAQVHELIAWAAEADQPITLIGEGANVVISDTGISGLTMRFGMRSVSHEGTLVTAGAGLSFSALIDYCLEHNLLGLEEFSGIPGTVGGSVFINIHYFEWLLSTFIVGGTVIDRHTGLCHSVDRSWFDFGYNYSRLHEGNHYLIDATFALRSGNVCETAYGKGRSTEIIRHRRQRYPYVRTCGSFFRNFYDHEVTLMSNGKKMIYVAYYLDKLGLKGELAVGGAQVSYQHANMIVAQPGATSADVIAVARTMQERVFEAFGIIPQPECRLLGYAEYPLLGNKSI